MAEEQNKVAKDNVFYTLTRVEGEPNRRAYKVVSTVGVFKNGKQYKPGSDVQLDDQTAANFIAVGAVQEK